MSVNKLTSSVKPLTVVSTINDIIDNLGGSYSATNPTLTPVNGICTWVVTHNLGTKNVICTLYSGNLEISKSVNLDSNNALTITFNALDTVAAGTCTAVVVAQGGTASGGGGSEYSLPTASTTTLGGVKIDGTSITINDGVISSAGGTVDSTLSSTSTNPVQNKVLYPSLSKFVPAGTYYIKSDGTGDFTKLSEALNFLKDKYSNDNVRLQIGDDTIIEYDSNIYVDFMNNITIQIKGNSATGSKIQFTKSTFNSCGLELRSYGHVNLRLQDVTFEAPNASSGTYSILRCAGGFYVMSHGTVNFKGNNRYPSGLHIYEGARYTAYSEVNFENLSEGLITTGADVSSGWNPKFNFTNCGTAFTLYNGGILRLYSPTNTYSNVSTKCNITANQVNSNGIVMGFTP